MILLPVMISAQKTISSDSVKNYIGQEVIVKGEITQVTVTKSGLVFFNIDGKYPNNKFTAVIFKKDVEKFGELKYWEGKIVTMKGMIEEYKGSLEMKLKNQGQLTFLKTSSNSAD
jgi:DNA/RNA endonuclease YhcR with UshA esterase domain